MKYFSTLLLFFSSVCSLVHAQYSYDFSNIPFYTQDDTLDFPMAEGLNAPVFAPIDLDLDGKKDILVLEKYGDLLYPFINKGDSGEVKYSYEPSLLSVLPDNIQSWIISADYNCDGRNDLFFMINNFVMVMENQSSAVNGFKLGNLRAITFDNMGFQERLNFLPIYKPAISDIDGDGDIDILSIGDYGQVRYYKNLSIERTSSCGLDFEIRAKCWGLFTEDFNTSEILLDSCELGKDPINERNKGSKHAGGTVTALDVDGNETMDLIVGDVSQDHLTLLINGDNTMNRTSSHIISADSDFPSYNKPVYLKSFPAAYSLDVNNDNLNDLLISSFNIDRAEPAWTENMVHYYQNTGNAVNDIFSFQQADFLVGEMINLGRGAHPYFYDINSDGLLDIIAGNMGRYDTLSNQFKASLAYFENVGSSLVPEFKLIDEDFANVSDIKLQGGYYAQALYPAIADLNNDGKAEMLLGDDYGKIHLFRDSSSIPNQVDFRLVKKYYGNIGLESVTNSSPTFYDLNKDGLLDLIIGHDNGTMDFYPNWGDKNKAVFNLEIDSIIHGNGDTVRYYFEKSQNISRLLPGQVLDFNGDSINTNAGERVVLLVDTVEKYVSVLKNQFDTKRVNEYTTEKLAFYGIRKLGGVDIRNGDASNGMATPFFYEYKNKTRMLSGSEIGTIYYYNDIDGNLDSNFTLVDTNYMNQDFGNYAFLSGADINSDGKPDIAIGNEAGGFKIFYANGVIGLEEHSYTSPIGFSIFPNPSSGEFTVELKNFNHNDNFSLRVFDAVGKIVKEQKLSSGRADLSLNVPNGLYFVQIYGRNTSEVRKVIVKQ